MNINLLYKLNTFINKIETRSHLFIKNVGNCIFPSNMTFPKAKRLTAIDWDKNTLCYNMNRTHFPNVERIDYLCDSPGSYRVLLHFFEGKNGADFKWAIPKKHHRFFNDISDNYLIKLTDNEIHLLRNCITYEDEILWNHYKQTKYDV